MIPVRTIVNLAALPCATLAPGPVTRTSLGRYSLLLTVALAGACSGPTAPQSGTAGLNSAGSTPPLSQTETVSGTVYVRDAAGLSPLAGGGLGAWDETSSGGGWMPVMNTDTQGRYSTTVAANSELHLVGDYYSFQQPCAAATAVQTGPKTLDVVLISDPSLLGGTVPSDVIAGSRTVSGMVYETVQGARRPLPNISVVFDVDGQGIIFATTTTGNDGRYLLCGLNDETSVFVEAFAEGFSTGTAKASPGSVNVDIELSRSSNGQSTSFAKRRLRRVR